MQLFQYVFGSTGDVKRQVVAVFKDAIDQEGDGYVVVNALSWSVIMDFFAGMGYKVVSQSHNHRTLISVAFLASPSFLLTPSPLGRTTSSEKVDGIGKSAGIELTKVMMPEMTMEEKEEAVRIYENILGGDIEHEKLNLAVEEILTCHTNYYKQLRILKT